MAVPLHAKQAHRGSRGIVVCIRDLSTKGVGGHWHTLATSSPGNRPSTLCKGGWLGLRVGLGGSKISCPHQHLNPRPSVYSKSLC